MRVSNILLNMFCNYFLYQITPPLDVESVSQTLKQKNILPSALKFGFLGLGIMGSGIVKNLLNSGHSVIVWNRSPDKVRHIPIFYWQYAGVTWFRSRALEA
jgi:hypothetical protein